MLSSSNRRGRMTFHHKEHKVHKGALRAQRIFVVYAFFAFFAVAILLLSSCAGTIHELANDSAVVGMTGFGISIGAAPSPSSPTPMPSISMWYGTIWRIGKHDNVVVKVNSSATATQGGAQLSIAATNNEPAAAAAAVA